MDVTPFQEEVLLYLKTILKIKSRARIDKVRLRSKGIMKELTN